MSNFFARSVATAADRGPQDELSGSLLREQYRSLATLIPFLYGVVVITTVALAYTTRLMAPVFVTVVLPAPLIAIALSRLRYWLKARRRVDERDLSVIRRDMLATTILGPSLALGFMLIGSISIPAGDAFPKLLVLVVIWITAITCAFCLFALPRAAALVVLGSTAPLIFALLREGGEMMVLLSGVLVLIAGLIAYMLRENFRNFSEIVRSRAAVAEQGRQAEAARREAEIARDAATVIAHSDPLTGLSNRRHFRALLEARTRNPALADAPFAVGMLDLDGFKPVNDVYGHAAGDAILRQVAARLAGMMRGQERLARVGGDEFAVIVEDVGAVAQAMARGREIQSCFIEPFPLNSTFVRIKATCGFCLHTSALDDPVRLVDRADMALYRIKATERGGVAVFDALDERLAVERARMESALRAAVAANAIDVHFQPIVDLATGEICGFESLARWTDPELGIVPPGVFIPLAEQAGLIEDITDLLLTKAAAIAARWPERVTLSFNISAEQLCKPGAGPKIASILRSCGLSPRRFEAEVTETAIMKDLINAKLTLEHLRSVGASVALDDFGTGYSSLGQIRALPLDRVKIDKSFIDDVCRDPRIATMVRSLILMCRGLELTCVAEGIENSEQLAALQIDGCHWGQGFLISRPLPIERANALLGMAARDAA